MKRVLIAYDGSAGAEGALENLVEAGLPAELEAKVLTIADVWLPPGDAQRKPVFPDHVPQTLQPHQHAEDAVNAARQLASKGAERLQNLFPSWNIQPASRADSPAWGIIGEARDWNADLIVIGSHGRSVLERFFLGSVSAKVAAEASCSVRIFRPHPASGAASRILIAADGSSDSRRAVQEAASRNWPPGAEFQIVTIIEPKLRTAGWSPFLPEEWRAAETTGEGWVASMLRDEAAVLSAKGWRVETRLLEGEAKHALLNQAKEWGAASIFMGARGLDHGNRLYLGTFASAIATRAHCSVEIIRPPAADNAPHPA